MFDKWAVCCTAVAGAAFLAACRGNSYDFNFGDAGFFGGPAFGLLSGPPCPGADEAGIVTVDAGANYDPGRCEADAQECVAYAPSCIDRIVQVRSWGCSCLGGTWSCEASTPLAFAMCENSEVDSGTE
jgi:hypothetical protein